MKKGITVILGIILAVLIIANGAVYLSTDRTGPEITFPSVYTVTADSSEDDLLKGISATDEKEGDVTDSLRIASVIPSEDGSAVTITYAAKDSHNNVTKVSRMFDLSKANTTDTADTADKTESAPQDSSAGETGETSEKSRDEEAETKATPTPTPAAETTAQQREDAQEEADEAAIAALPAGSPVIRLTTHHVTLPAGTAFNYMDYIESMSDDADSAETLSQRIEVAGDVDTATPGTYGVTYTISDLDGNRSNSPTLEVVVQ